MVLALESEADDISNEDRCSAMRGRIAWHSRKNACYQEIACYPKTESVAFSEEYQCKIWNIYPKRYIL